MLLKDVTLASPRDNILYDEVLLSLAERGGGREVLRFWESPGPFIVLGRISRTEEDLFIEAATEDRVPVLRRSSGGGTVLQGRGCLNYSLILSKERDPRRNDLHKSYEDIFGRIIGALRSRGLDVAARPLSDLVLCDGERKFSGNAQHRGRRFFLHHGTLLYDFDLRLMEKYLKIPVRMPDYRRGRGHRDFLSNLPLPLFRLKEAVRAAFGARQEESRLTEEETACLDDFRTAGSSRRKTSP